MNAIRNSTSTDLSAEILAATPQLCPAAPVQARRHTTATDRRIKQMKALIAEFSTREMMMDEACFLLGFSPSGTRKYIKALRDAGVIELSRYIGGTASYIGKQVFRLSDDQDIVDAFIATLSGASVAAQHGAVPMVKHRMPEVPGRHLHIMGDDVPYSVRAWRGTPTRDPLVAAFFGPARAEGFNFPGGYSMVTESPPCAHFALPLARGDA